MRTFGQTFGKWGPLGLSVVATLLVLGVASTGWERGLKDEGAAAHIWQGLMVLQLPLIGLFLATADWRRPMAVARMAALQALALLLALAPVAALGL